MLAPHVVARFTRHAPRAALLLAVAGCLACQADPGRKQHRANAASFSRDGLEGGSVVFEDRFDAATLGKGWKAHPRAKVVDGALRIENNRNEPPIWLDLKLPEKVRISFDVKALSPEGDIKVEVFGDGARHQSGYILVFGAHQNSEDWLARLDEHGADRVTRPSKGVEQDRTYKMAIVRTDQQVRWFVDDEPFMVFDDPEPLTGDEHAYFAFNCWTAPLAFDNLKIVDLAR